MSVNSTGVNKTAAEDFMNTLISGGVNILLIGGSTNVSYTDTSTEISGYSKASVSVTESDLSISTPSDFSGTTDLFNDNQLDFGTVDIGTVYDVVIQNQSNPNRFAVANETNNHNTSGQTATLPSGTKLYSFGNP